MAEITFPTSPSDEDEYTFNGVTYQYEASSNKWKVVGDALAEDVGQWVLISETEITGSPTVVDVVDLDRDVYSMFLIKVESAENSTVTDTINLITSSDNGLNFDDGSNNYAISGYILRNNSAIVGSFTFTHIATVTSSTGKFDIDITFSSGSNTLFCQSFAHNATYTGGGYKHGRRLSATLFNAIRLFFQDSATETFDAGFVKVYGVRK